MTLAANTVVQGAADNDGLGDTGRTPFRKYNQAISELYTAWLFMGTPSGDATGATDTATLNTLVASLPSAGGGIMFGPGTYYLSGAYTFSKAVALQGQGSSDGYKNGGNTASTTVSFPSSTTGGGFIFTVTASVRGIHVTNPSTSVATAGAGFYLNNAPGSLIDNCSTYGFYVGIDVLSSNAYNITNNKIYNPSGYGGRHTNAVDDEGDCSWYGNFIDAAGINGTTPTAGFLWVSGGGVRFINNKINREPNTVPAANWFKYGIQAQPTGGTTGDIMIVGNSIENWVNYGIFLDASVATGGSVDAIRVYSNQFQGNGTGSYALYISGSSVFNWNDVGIDDSACRVCGGYVNAYQYCNNVYIGSVTADVFTSTPILIGAAGGSSQTTSTVLNVSYDISKVQIKGPAATQSIFVDQTVNASDGHKQGPQLKIFSREIPNLGTVPSSVTVGQIIVRAYQCARVRVTVCGSFTGVGAIFLQQEYYLTCASTALTATAIGTPVSSSPAVTLTVNTATNFTAIFSLNTVSGQGLSATVGGSGQITFQMEGALQEFDRLN